jgi:hypothetical protein
MAFVPKSFVSTPSWASQFAINGAVHRVSARSVYEVLAGLGAAVSASETNRKNKTNKKNKTY